MNKRIRELAQQAQKVVGYTDGGYTEIKALDEEKFAELIVEEMYDFVMEESASDNGIPDLGKVKQHFGVEE